MKCLAIDSSCSKMILASRNGPRTVTLSLDIGMKQSERILPSIDYVLSQNDLSSSDLDCSVLCSGPGSFTGLRLAFSALKAIEMAHGIPVYGVPTLDCIAFPYRTADFTVLPLIDAKKNRFYAAVYTQKEELLPPGDYEPAEICAAAATAAAANRTVLLCGPGKEAFTAALAALPAHPPLSLTEFKGSAATTDALFAFAEKALQEGTAPLKDFEGPVYLRASEAEVKTGA
ncbi:MAG: tRNA (adenosine(37)-N6)-threonylcarbamoyltransferase complex dimerization subunit type 1 TsaB [Treponema sp.]|jgi:tRNA threonylcarbamoyladenosine biosynthesis protein TsaB|nr:tRNA (adenosine(37)-N6)-threonylcarbamoyltransferase complex dimerization subunit type 1 TsaB [Treponema sp.]